MKPQVINPQETTRAEAFEFWMNKNDTNDIFSISSYTDGWCTCWTFFEIASG